MNKAKSCKIFLLLLACFLSFACLFASLSITPVKALSTEGYFLLNGSSSDKLVFEEDVLKASVKEGDVLAFKNSLNAKDLTLNLTNLTGVDVFSVNLVIDSFYANGSEKEDGIFDTQIKNTLKINLKDGTASLNGAEDESFTLEGNLDIVFKLENNFLTAEIEGEEIKNSSSDYYKLKEIDEVPAKVDFTFDTISVESVDFKLVSVGQKTGDANYTQTFVLTEGKLTPAKPIVYLSDNFFNADASDITVISGYQYKPTINVLSVMGKGSETYSLVEGDSESNRMTILDSGIIFKLENEDYINGASKTMNFGVKNKSGEVVKTYTVDVVTDLGGEGKAPEYKNPNDVEKELNNFERSLLAKTKAEYEVNGETVEGSVRIGAGEYLEIPSLENLVYDNATSYENLTMTIRYRTKSNDWETATNKKIPLNIAGTYEFYVMFKDVNGNTMEYEDFIDEENAENEPIYSRYIFSFTVLDDAPISVEASTQGKGYKGIEYNATGFTIKASDYTTEYSLFYRANAEANWVKIPELSDIEEGYLENGFAYKDVEKIAYNGLLTFTPDRLGQYKIVCDVVSNSAHAKSQSAEALILVEEVPTRVVPDNHWFEENIWSVLFLTVGTLSLVAIIVLLCKKPKDNDVAKRKK